MPVGERAERQKVKKTELTLHWYRGLGTTPEMLSHWARKALQKCWNECSGYRKAKETIVGQHPTQIRWLLDKSIQQIGYIFDVLTDC